MTFPSSSELARRGAGPLRRRLGTVVLLAAVVGAVAVAGLGATQLISAIAGGGNPNARLAGWDDRRTPGTDDVVALKVLADEWNERITAETFWRGRRNNSSQSAAPAIKTAPNRLQGPQPPPAWFVAPSPGFWGQPEGAQPPQSGGLSTPHSFGGLRTICVRLCDGYFFPVSFGGSEGRLGRDQTTCSTACPGARLFYSRTHSDDIDDMVDLNGQRYSRLPNANLFRTQYVESCKCKPHAWEEAAVERHRIYALEDRRRKGDRSVTAELEELKAKRQVEERVMRSNRKSSRPSRRGADERASLVTPKRVVDAGPVFAPRSDASRGQSGAAIAQRLGSVAVTTGSIGTVSRITSTASLPAQLQLSIEPPVEPTAIVAVAAAAPAPAPVNAPGPAVAAGAVASPVTDAPTGAGEAAAVHPAAEGVRNQGNEATPAAAAPAKRSASTRKSMTRQAQVQAKSSRPEGMMRLGAQQAAAPRRAPALTGGWVRQVFSH